MAPETAWCLKQAERDTRQRHTDLARHTAAQMQQFLTIAGVNAHHHGARGHLKDANGCVTFQIGLIDQTSIKSADCAHLTGMVRY